MAKWWIGCSGFHYKHWKERFYPEGLAQRKWFEYYSERFNTFELNVTFYRFPRLPVLEAWYQQSPEAYSFSVKVPRAITHFKQFYDTERMLGDFYGTITEGLKEKVGCVLFQMPPRMAYKEETLERILDSLDPSFNNVLEFRHESWWNAEVYKKLSKQNVTFCGMSHPQLPDDVVQNTSIVYFRFHGVPHLYWSKYEFAALKKVADEIEGNKKTKAAFIYFNNDADVAAIDDALAMAKYVEEQKGKANRKRPK